MNKESIAAKLNLVKENTASLKIVPPGTLTPGDTADRLINLLEAVYIKHGITQDKQKLVKDIENKNVLAWFAQKNEQFVATASLIKQSNESWELGRAVSFSKRAGEHLMLTAALEHLTKHPSSPLLAEVRVADTFLGIASGEATQHICFDLLQLVPHALIPLFAHGEPLRHEPFVLSASTLPPGKTISERIAEAVKGRSSRGIISRTKIIQEKPFRLIVPNENGQRTMENLRTLTEGVGCTLFAIESTDRNLPLIGMLSANPAMIVCGVDWQKGPENKPIILIATLGFRGDLWTGKHSLLAPANISETLPLREKNDLRDIASRFADLQNNNKTTFRAEHHNFWRIEKDWPRMEEVWEI